MSNDDSTSDEQNKPSLKDRIAQSAGVNPKTVERNTKALLFNLFGVTEQEVESDPALKAYLRYLLYGEDPAPYVILEKEDAEKKE